MGGDAIGAGSFGDQGGAQRVGPDRATGIAHGGDVINVDAKPLPSEMCHRIRPLWF
jgi:hypothetical protein